MFLAPGLYKNIKKSVIDGVRVSELDICDPSLKEKILKHYRSIVKLRALKESLYSHRLSINGGITCYSIMLVG